MVLPLQVLLSLLHAGLSLSLLVVGLIVCGFYLFGVVHTRFIRTYVYNLALCYATNSTGMLDFPFSKITVDDTNFNALNLKLTCKDMFLNIKECAEQCYYGDKNGVG